MNLFKANKNNIQSIMKIIGEAQAYLASKEIDQWQNGYPERQVILNDILNLESYVVTNEAKKIMATTMFTTRTEPTYAFIDGEWITPVNATYGVIHRMAVSNDFRKQGIAKFIFNTCEQHLKTNEIASMRIDTHEDNNDMQMLLKRLEYSYCGVIYLDNGDKRLAFEKVFKK